MSTYLVTVPVAGIMTIEVEAASKDEAIEYALYTHEDIIGLIDEIDVYRHLTQGNMLYAPLNSAYAQEI